MQWLGGGPIFVGAHRCSPVLAAPPWASPILIGGEPSANAPASDRVHTPKAFVFVAAAQFEFGFEFMNCFGFCTAILITQLARWELSQAHQRRRPINGDQCS